VQISTILDSIDQQSFALPEFQRGYVWSRDQVRHLFHSLYRRFPVGSLLVWTTKADVTERRGMTSTQWQVVKLILDGQQRITSLYGVMRGHPPVFFQGNEQAFTNLYFDVRTETFEFYGPVKMKDDPLWINVTELFKTGLGEASTRLNAVDGISPDMFAQYLDRVIRVHSIREIDLHIEEITGPVFDVDTVVEIFNRVNSGGTKLSTGDLALAKICAEWPAARNTMREYLERWAEAGFGFSLDWLLRNTNAIVTGEAMFSALKDVGSPAFQDGLARAVKAIDKLLNLVGARLGLDHKQVLGGIYAFPVMARYLDQRGGRLDVDEESRLLFWYVHSAIWGRHSGSAETMLNTDLRAIADGGLERLIEVLELWRGDLTVRPEHFAGAERGSRFYTLLYLLTRVGGSQDFGTGLPLSKHLLGKLSKLELHHIFPNAMLRDLGFDRRERNALGNFCFLTQETNLAIGKKPPSSYLQEYEDAHPGVLASQWIPMDRALWEPDRYEDFLAERRRLLAAAANEFLASLRAGLGSGETIGDGGMPSSARVVVTSADDEDEDVVGQVVEMVRGLGLAEPVVPFEALDEHGDVLYEADAGWPDGLQVGLSEPCAFLVEPDAEMEARLSEGGVRFFTDVGAFCQYVETLVGIDLDADGVIGPERES
jgi:hypothetical protein